MPRPCKPPDKHLLWVVCHVTLLNAVNVVVLLGHGEVLWKILDQMCGAFVLQRVLTQWIWNCHACGTLVGTIMSQQWAHHVKMS